MSNAINVVCFDVVKYPRNHTLIDDKFHVNFTNLRIFFHGPWKSGRRPFCIVSDYLCMRNSGSSAQFPDGRLHSFLSDWQGYKLDEESVYTLKFSDLRDMLLGMNATIQFEIRPGEHTAIRKIGPCVDERVLQIKSGFRAPWYFYPKSEQHREQMRQKTMDIPASQDGKILMPNFYERQTDEKTA